MNPESLVQVLEEFLFSGRDALIEDGAVAFDLAHPKYSISGECNKCPRISGQPSVTLVRRVLDAQIKNDVLKLLVQRLGQNQPAKLEICRHRDRRTATAQRQHRLNYANTLKIILARHFPSTPSPTSAPAVTSSAHSAPSTLAACSSGDNPLSPLCLS